MAVKTGIKGNVKIGSTAIGLAMTANFDVAIDEEDTTPFDPGGTAANWAENTPTIRRISGSIEGNLDYSDAGQKSWIDEVMSGSTMLLSDVTIYPYGTDFGVKGNAIPKFSGNLSSTSVSKFTFSWTGTGKWTIVTS